MTATLEVVASKKVEPTAEQKAAEELVRRARDQGLSLTSPDGLLKQLIRRCWRPRWTGGDRAPRT
jgi:putative transposase